MSEQEHPAAGSVAEISAPLPHNDPTVDALREILLRTDRQRVAELEDEVARLRTRVADPDQLVSLITPVLGDAIRQSIRNEREEIVDALYPIIGQLVVRAVSESIRDLARTIDERLRVSVVSRFTWRRLFARLGGIPESELALREALPFAVTEVFLIHRDSGLMLSHVSQRIEGTADSDLISGMLTAIREFVQDAFGEDDREQLDEIQYGDRSIIIETARRCYLAVVVDGIEPAGFRENLRQHIVAIDRTYRQVLDDYDGNPLPLSPATERLQSLLLTIEPAELDFRQVLVTLVIITLLVAAFLAGLYLLFASM